MALQMMGILTEDVEGGETDWVITFSLDGMHYEIDLNNASGDRLAATLLPSSTSSSKPKPIPDQGPPPTPTCRLGVLGHELMGFTSRTVAEYRNQPRRLMRNVCKSVLFQGAR